jgi:hypothetical protein
LCSGARPASGPASPALGPPMPPDPARSRAEPGSRFVSLLFDFHFTTWPVPARSRGLAPLALCLVTIQF